MVKGGNVGALYYNQFLDILDIAYPDGRVYGGITEHTKFSIFWNNRWYDTQLLFVNGLVILRNIGVFQPNFLGCYARVLS